MARHNTIGVLGEQVVERFLREKGFRICDRNYLRAYGEIDLIAEKQGIVHFVEVKAVSYETKQALEYAVTHETYRPEENVHPQKLQRIKRTLQAWILEHAYKGEYQIDVVAVRMVAKEKYARIAVIENIVAE